jgi:hypothetical protein
LAFTAVNFTAVKTVNFGKLIKYRSLNFIIQAIDKLHQNNVYGEGSMLCPILEAVKIEVNSETIDVEEPF